MGPKAQMSAHVVEAHLPQEEVPFWRGICSKRFYHQDHLADHHKHRHPAEEEDFLSTKSAFELRTRDATQQSREVSEAYYHSRKKVSTLNEAPQKSEDVVVPPTSHRKEARPVWEKATKLKPESPARGAAPKPESVGTGWDAPSMPELSADVQRPTKAPDSAVDVPVVKPTPEDLMHSRSKSSDATEEPSRTPVGSAPEQQPLTTPEDLMPLRSKLSNATEEPPTTPVEPTAERRPLTTPESRVPGATTSTSPLVVAHGSEPHCSLLVEEVATEEPPTKKQQMEGTLPSQASTSQQSEGAGGALDLHPTTEDFPEPPATPGRGWWGKPVVEEPLPRWVPDVAAHCSCPEVADALRRHAAATEALTLAVQANTAQQQATQTLLERLGERLAPMPHHPVNTRRHRQVSPDRGHDQQIREARSRPFHCCR